MSQCCCSHTSTWLTCTAHTKTLVSKCLGHKQTPSSRDRQRPSQAGFRELCPNIFAGYRYGINQTYHSCLAMHRGTWPAGFGPATRERQNLDVFPPFLFILQTFGPPNLSLRKVQPRLPSRKGHGPRDSSCIPLLVQCLSPTPSL